MRILRPLQRLAHALCATCMVGGALLGTGCCAEAPPSPDEADAKAPRIVSLSPALTQALIDLGMQDALVGRTPFAPDQVASVPVVGDLLDPDLERILAVEPTLLLVQPTASGVDPALRELAEARGWEVADWRIDRVADVREILHELPALLARHGADEPSVRAAVDQWITRSDELLVPCPEIRSAGRVLVLYGVDPPAAFGPETYVDDILRGLGATNALVRPGYPELSLEDLIVLAPDTVLVLGDPEREAILADRFSASDYQPRLLGVDGGALLVPGTRLLDGVERLRSVFGCSSEPIGGIAP